MRSEPPNRIALKLRRAEEKCVTRSPTRAASFKRLLAAARGVIADRLALGALRYFGAQAGGPR
jgi:hypothetical protein